MFKKPHIAVLASSIAVALVGCTDDDGRIQEPAPVELPVLGAATPATLSGCDALVENFSYDDVTIDSAELVDAGEIDYDGRGEMFRSPAHCIITGTMEPRMGNGLQGSTEQAYAIGFEMRLPVDWNGRYLYQANGGLDGRVNKAVGRFMNTVSYEASALNKGFAVISSDAGHEGYGEQYFGLDHQARINYGYGAVEKLTPMAKDLIEAAYGKQPDRSYFTGCSNGGRHTMVAATRFPEMYDGYLVGNPGHDLPKAAISQLYGVQQFATLIPEGTAMTTSDEIQGAVKATVTANEYQLVAKAIIKQCDGLDGAADGMVNDLAGCQEAFDIERDVETCNGERDGTCLTAAQKLALGNIMVGPQNSAGEAIYNSFPYDVGIGASGWASWEMVNAFSRDAGTVATVFTTAPVEFADYNTRGDAGLKIAYDYAVNYDMDEDAPLIFNTTSEFPESSMSFMSTGDEAEYATLRDRGAKMILLHGTSDPVFSAQQTIDWYNAVDEANTGDADKFARLFLMPGMNHCGSGPAADQVDTILDDIVAWVEQGTAPESITAAVREENSELPEDWAKDRTRPLCPYPQIATYNGSGDIEKASSFSCVAPQ